MTNSILLQNVSPEALTELIKEGVKSQLEDFKNNFNTHTNELLTREQTCYYLQIDSSTLWHLTNKGKVTAHGIGNRKYYKKAELLEFLTPLKNKAMSTIDTQCLNPDSDRQNKGKHFQDQFTSVYKGFFEQPQSMKMLSIKLNIDRSNICWFCRELRINNKICIAKKGVCKVTNRVVNFYTTNPDLFPKSNQLKMF